MHWHLGADMSLLIPTLRFQGILTVVADTTNDLFMPCHEQWPGAATANRTRLCDTSVVLILLILYGVFKSRPEDLSSIDIRQRSLFTVLSRLH